MAAAIGHRDHLAESGRATTDLLRRVEAGIPTDPRAHIRHRHDPEPPPGTPRWLAEFWAATSGGLLLLIVAAVLVLPTPHKPFGAARRRGAVPRAGRGHPRARGGVPHRLHDRGRGGRRASCSW